RVFEHRRHEIFASKDVVDDAESFSFVEIEGLTQSHQFNCLGFSYQASKPLSPARAWQYSQVHFGKTDFACILARNADVGGHGYLQAAADAVSVDSGNHQFGSVLEAQQGFIGMEAKIILVGGIHTGKHVDIRARGEELVA